MKIILILVMVPFLFFGCSLFSDYANVVIVFPDKPHGWADPDGSFSGTLEFPSGPDTVETVNSEWGRELKVRILKNTQTPVVWTGSGSLKPAGALYPRNSESGDRLNLSWDDGFLALLLLDLSKKEIDFSNININRMADEIELKSEGDPWSLDRELLMEAVIYNSLSVYKIKALGKLTITIGEEGTWIPDNVFRAKVLSLDGDIVLQDIYEGLHRYWNPESGEFLDLMVDDDGFRYMIY